MSKTRTKSDSSGKHEIYDVVCKHATDKAILVEIDGEEVWVPQSQVDEDSEVYQKGDEGTLIVSEWFAKQRGWV
jgi:hypothetical protein